VSLFEGADRRVRRQRAEEGRWLGMRLHAEAIAGSESRRKALTLERAASCSVENPSLEG
jgi:hypothetical protein